MCLALNRLGQNVTSFSNIMEKNQTYTSQTTNISKTSEIHHHYNTIQPNIFNEYVYMTFSNEQVKFQLAHFHVHRNNAAEKAIQMLKNNVTTGICTCNSRFPDREWDIILPQASSTLNLLRSSRRNSSSSIYAGIFGKFNFNVTSLAPPGIKVLIHIKA